MDTGAKGQPCREVHPALSLMLTLTQLGPVNEGREFNAGCENGKLPFLLGCRAVNTVFPSQRATTEWIESHSLHLSLQSYRSKSQKLPYLKKISLAFKMVLCITTQINEHRRELLCNSVM